MSESHAIKIVPVQVGGQPGEAYAVPQFAWVREAQTGTSAVTVELLVPQDATGGPSESLGAAARRTWNDRRVYTEEDIAEMDCPYPPDPEL